MSTENEAEVPVEVPVVEKEPVPEAPSAPEQSTEAAPAVPPAAPADGDNGTNAADKPSSTEEAASTENKVEDSVDSLPVPADGVVDSVTDHIENLTIFGNKSLDELHRIQAKRSHLSAGILFSDPSLMIPKPILESLTLEMRFEKPSEIQASTLPILLQRHNLIAQAQSGAGKTIAFVIGMLCAVDTRVSRLQALCLTPTRELANQILRDAVLPLS
eukprot:gene30950-37405_t